MFPLALLLRKYHFPSLSDMFEMPKTLFDGVVQYRNMTHSAVVAGCKRQQFDRYSNFAGIGEG